MMIFSPPIKGMVTLVLNTNNLKGLARRKMEKSEMKV